MPKCAIAAFGQEVVRYRLGSDSDVAKALGQHLTKKLDEVWAATSVRPISIERLLFDAKPNSLDLVEALELCLSRRSVSERPVRLAAEALIRVAGNKDISLYDRGDARRLVRALQDKGNKSATVRRRVQSLHALLELGYLEKDETKHNPFARLSIAGEGRDALKRGVLSGQLLCCGIGTGLDRRKN